MCCDYFYGTITLLYNEIFYVVRNKFLMSHNKTAKSFDKSNNQFILKSKNLYQVFNETNFQTHCTNKGVWQGCELSLTVFNRSVHQLNDKGIETLQKMEPSWHGTE
jgi:hypothetical protein